jgi:hypothetical protein
VNEICFVVIKKNKKSFFFIIYFCLLFICRGVKPSPRGLAVGLVVAGAASEGRVAVPAPALGLASAEAAQIRGGAAAAALLDPVGDASLASKEVTERFSHRRRLVFWGESKSFEKKRVCYHGPD